MTRHSFRWDSLIFGLLFVGAASAWAVWSADLLTERQLAFAAAGGLIVLGVLGIAGTLVKSRPEPVTARVTAPKEASDDAEATDPQP